MKKIKSPSKYFTPYQYKVQLNKFLRKGTPKNDYSISRHSLDFFQKEYAKWRDKRYKTKGWKTRRKNMLERYRKWAWEEFTRANIDYHTDAPINLYEEFGPLNPVDYPEYFYGTLFNKWNSYVQFYFGGDEEWAVFTSRALTMYYNREDFYNGDDDGSL